MVVKKILILGMVACLSISSSAFIYGLDFCPALKGGHYNIEATFDGGDVAVSGVFQDNKGHRWSLSGQWPGVDFNEGGLKSQVKKEILSASDRLFSASSSSSEITCDYATANRYVIELYRRK